MHVKLWKIKRSFYVLKSRFLFLFGNYRRDFEEFASFVKYKEHCAFLTTRTLHWKFVIFHNYFKMMGVFRRVFPESNGLLV